MLDEPSFEAPASAGDAGDGFSGACLPDGEGLAAAQCEFDFIEKRHGHYVFRVGRGVSVESYGVQHIP